MRPPPVKILSWDPHSFNPAIKTLAFLLIWSPQLSIQLFDALCGTFPFSSRAQTSLNVLRAAFLWKLQLPSSFWMPHLWRDRSQVSTPTQHFFSSKLRIVSFSWSWSSILSHTVGRIMVRQISDFSLCGIFASLRTLENCKWWLTCYVDTTSSVSFCVLTNQLGPVDVLFGMICTLIAFHITSCGTPAKKPFQGLRRQAKQSCAFPCALQQVDGLHILLQWPTCFLWNRAD